MGTMGRHEFSIFGNQAHWQFNLTVEEMKIVDKSWFLLILICTVSTILNGSGGGGGGVKVCGIFSCFLIIYWASISIFLCLLFWDASFPV